MLGFEEEDEGSAEVNSSIVLHLNIRNQLKFDSKNITRGFFVGESFEEEYASPSPTLPQIETTRRKRKQEAFKSEKDALPQQVEVQKSPSKKETPSKPTSQEQIGLNEPPQQAPASSISTSLVAQQSPPVYETKRRAMKRKVELEKLQQTKPVESESTFREEEVPFQNQVDQTVQLEPQPLPQPEPQPEQDNLEEHQIQQLITNDDIGQVQHARRERTTIIHKKDDYFSTSGSIFHKELSQEVKAGTALWMQLLRDRDGFNTFWPQFHLIFPMDGAMVLSAKKTSSKPTSTFILSSKKGEYTENGPYYLGKMKSNLLGDILNIFGPGPNPSLAKDLNVRPRELLATIVYYNSVMQLGKPRQFKVFVKRNDVNYYGSFKQVVQWGEELSLDTLYDYPENRGKIDIWSNRRPIFLKELNGYMLNFHGRVECPSIKNFILEDREGGSEVLLFGKINDNSFNLDVTAPMSPLLAAAIALSSFDSRMMCE